MRSTGNVCYLYFINHLRAQTHTCHLSVIWTESPSFSSNRNLLPRRLKSPSFEHRRFFPSTQSSSCFAVVPSCMTISGQLSPIVSNDLAPIPRDFFHTSKPSILRCCPLPSAHTVRCHRSSMPPVDPTTYFATRYRRL